MLSVGHAPAREVGVLPRLNVTGRVEADALVDLYRRAALTVVPSRYEGFGLPAVESMACGTPVVACRAGALPEVMSLCGGGLLVEKDSSQALASGIRELMHSPDQRRVLAERARERVEAHLSWRQVARATADGYAEVLAERRGLPTRRLHRTVPATDGPSDPSPVRLRRRPASGFEPSTSTSRACPSPSKFHPLFPRTGSSLLAHESVRAHSG